MTTITVWLLFLSHAAYSGADQAYYQQPFTYASEHECESIGKKVKHKWGAFLCLPATAQIKVK